MTTISDRLTDKQRWTGLFIFDVVLKDGTPRFWSTQPVSFNSHPYSAVISSHSSMQVQGAGIYGVDQVMEIQFGLNNADLGLNSIITPANLQGGTIQPRFIYVDPTTGTVTTDAIIFPLFVFDLPSATWPICQVTANNRWNLPRKSLPASTLGRHDRYPFPSTAMERTVAGSDPTSIFFPCGYDPDNGKGNLTPGGGYYVGVAQGGAHEIVYDGTREMLKAAGLEIRWGGLGDVPPVNLQFNAGIDQGYFHNKAIPGSSANVAKFGQRVPLAFGIVRATGILLDTGGTPSGATWGGARLSHFLLADGVNFADSDADYGCKVMPDAPENWEPLVYLTGTKQGKLYRVPNLPTDPGAQGAFTIHPGTLGSQRCTNGGLSKYRNVSGTETDDYPVPDFNGRDLYSGLCFVDVGIPKELAQPESDTGPGVEVVFRGLKIETLDSGLNSVWQWSQNPVWIFIHLLKLIGWTWVNKQKAYDASAYCAATLAGGQPRFRCNLYLDKAYKVADVLRGIRNCCRMYTTYGSDGQLEINIEATTAEEGGTKFAIDSSNLLRGDDGITLCKKFHKSIYETANFWNIRYQEQVQGCIEDVRSRRNYDHINRTGQENDGSGQWPVLGCPGMEQADRLLYWIDYKSVGLNEYYRVTCSQALIGAQIGQIGTII